MSAEFIAPDWSAVTAKSRPNEVVGGAIFFLALPRHLP